MGDEESSKIWRLGDFPYTDLLVAKTELKGPTAELPVRSSLKEDSTELHWSLFKARVFVNSKVQDKVASKTVIQWFFLTQGIFGNVYRHLCHNFGLRAVEVALVLKNPNAKAGDLPGLGRSPGGWHGNPLQYYLVQVSWLRNLIQQWPTICNSKSVEHIEISSLFSTEHRPFTWMEQVIKFRLEFHLKWVYSLFLFKGF